MTKLIGYWGTCSCCGRSIFSSIDEKFFNWYCGGEKVGDACENYGNEKRCEEKCLLEKNTLIKKRLYLQRSFIKKAIMYIIKKNGCVYFPANHMILKSIEMIIPELSLSLINTDSIDEVRSQYIYAELL